MLKEVVEDYAFTEKMSVNQLVSQMDNAWGFTAGKLASGLKILKKMNIPEKNIKIHNNKKKGLIPDIETVDYENKIAIECGNIWNGKIEKLLKEYDKVIHLPYINGNTFKKSWKNDPYRVFGIWIRNIEKEIKMAEKKIFSDTRKLIQVGDSYMIAIPPVWLKQHGLEKGDEVLIVANADLKILSPKSRDEYYKKISKFVQGKIE